MRLPLRSACLAIATTCFLLTPGLSDGPISAAQAQAPGAPAKATVKLTVSIIHATKTPGGVAPELKAIKADLESVFAGYTAFKRLDRKELTLAPGAKGTLQLPTKQTAEVTWRGLAEASKPNGLHKVKFSVPNTRVDVDLRTPMGKVFYQAGLKHEDGILILAMMIE